ncbi:hypothetical protein [Brevundimonas sp. NIBR10]|uniref:hypothetical protein n=1 Tax=Brevundimonas sp. NIBR10 TaxID=3015997 RepID=UPI0022F1D95E|nr:hypothetical protein [Brevundimonas sp. NIBR10]
MIGRLHPWIRGVIALLGGLTFLFSCGVGLWIFLTEIVGKFGGDVFHNGANDAVAMMIVGMFGGAAYLLANIDRKLEKREG